jgi:hypothetical protein
LRRLGEDVPIIQLYDFLSINSIIELPTTVRNNKDRQRHIGRGGIEREKGDQRGSTSSTDLDIEFVSGVVIELDAILKHQLEITLELV